MMFLYRHLFGRGHALLTLQLHRLEEWVVLLVDAIFLLCLFNYLCHVVFATVANLDVVFIEILIRGLLLEKFLEIKFMKSQPILDDMH